MTYPAPGWGFVCPRCAVKLPTEAVQAAAPGLRLRARLCPRCGHVELTRERAVRRPELLADRPGFFCRKHPGRALDVTHVLRVGPRIIVRYLQCPRCPAHGHVCRHGPARAGVPMVRSEERAAAPPPGCATPVSTLARVCESG